MIQKLLPTIADLVRTLFLGLVLSKQLVAEISLKELTTHTLMIGRTGTGKSKLAQHLIRQFRDAFLPVILLDGEGDLAEDAFADVIAEVRDTGCDEILKRTHYLRAGDWKRVFSVDPFDNSAVPGDPTAQQAWLHRTATQFANAIIRSRGETSFDQMPRLERVLIDLLIAIGTPLPDGRRLPLASVFILLNFDHPKFTQIWTLVAPQLPQYIRDDFERLLTLHHRNRPQDVLTQTESAINRLRSFLSPCVAAMFQEVQRQTLQLVPLIRERGIIIFNLRDSQYFAPEQANALGRVIIYMVLSALASIDDRGERIPTAFIVDECQRYMTPDLLDGLARGRKWGLMSILCTQTYSALERVSEGFGEEVLAAVGTVVCFQQRLPSDLEVLADYLFRPNLDYEEMVIEVDRHRGYMWLDVEEHSENWQVTKSWSDAVSRSLSVGQAAGTTWGHALSKLFAIGRNQQDSLTISNGTNHTSSSGTTNTRAEGEKQQTGMTPLFDGTRLIAMYPNQSDGTQTTITSADTCGEAHGTTNTKARSRAAGTSVVQADGQVNSLGGSLTNNINITNGATSTIGGSAARGGSVSHKKVPLAVILPEEQPQGRLRRTIEVQLDKRKTEIAQYPQSVGAVRREGQPTEVVEFPFIEDPFPNPKLKRALIAMYEEKLRTLHPYWTTPDASQLASERRLDAFISGQNASSKSQPVSTAATAPSTPPRRRTTF